MIFHCSRATPWYASCLTILKHRAQFQLESEHISPSFPMKPTFLRLPALMIVWLLSIFTPSHARTEAYKVVKTQPITGGKSKYIVISPESANETGLVALSLNLRETTLQERNAHVLIFTDVRAALLHNQSWLSEEKRSFHALHFVGRYVRDLDNAIHEVEIFPKGLDGPSKIIVC